MIHIFRMRKLILAFALLVSVSTFAQTPDLKIELHTGNPSEKKAEELVRGFAKQYDLSPYIFTSHIKIQSKVIPHSHPVLTLNTRQISEPDRYLALLLHEQIHWFFAPDAKDTQVKEFFSKVRRKYPKVPSREDGGASDVESTYLHFGVCYYELEALIKYLGEKKAIEIFSTEDVYPWIRKEVLANREWVKKTLLDSGLNWKDAGK